MDWFSLLLVFVFFILPLLQEAIMKSRRGKGDGSAGGSVETLPPPETPASTTSGRMERSTAEGGWSDSWGSWPGSDSMGIPEVEPGPPYRPAPESDPVVSYTPLEKQQEVREEVQYAAARTPLEELAAQLNRLGEIEMPQPPRPATPVTPAAPLRRAQRPKAIDRAAELHIRHPAELRKAIILAEVLGPPLSQRQNHEAA